MLTTSLEKAFAEASKLSEDERRWGKAFSDSSDKLSKLAEEALAEHHQGQTRVLDPEQL